MTRPWKRPDSGYYWFRKRVPDDLRNLLGKREERFSLGTRDPAEAKRLHALKLAEVEERWSNLRSGQRPLSPDDVAQYGAAIGEHLWRQVQADPYKQLQWDIEIGASLWSARNGPPYVDATQPLPPSDRKRLDQQGVCYWLVDRYFEEKGLSPPGEDREKLARAVTFEVQRVVQNHEAYLRGKQDVRVGGFALLERRAPVAPLTFEKMIEGWLREKKPNEKTEYSWRRVMKELSRFLDHDDARRVTADDLVKWKEELLAKERAAKTIRDSKLAPVRAIFQWAVDNRKLDANPAARINIDLKSRPSEMTGAGFAQSRVKIIGRHDCARTFFTNHRPRYRRRADRSDFAPIDKLRRPTLDIDHARKKPSGGCYSYI